MGDCHRRDSFKGNKVFSALLCSPRHATSAALGLPGAARLVAAVAAPAALAAAIAAAGRAACAGGAQGSIHPGQGAIAVQLMTFLVAPHACPLPDLPAWHCMC